MQAKSILVVLFALMVNTNVALAQANGTGTKKFQYLTGLNMDSSNPKLGNVKLINNDVYIVGAFNSIDAPSSPNGQASPLGGVVKFSNGNLKNPLAVGVGVSFPSGGGMTDITCHNGTLYMSGNGYDNGRLFSYNEALNTWETLPITADGTINYIDSINSTTILLIGEMTTINGVMVNHIAYYNPATGVVTPVTATGLGTDINDRPMRYSREGAKCYIATNNGSAIYNTETATLTTLSSPVQLAWDLAGHGDTTYICGPSSTSFGGGDVVWQQIGSGSWQPVAWTLVSSMASTNLINGKLLMSSQSEQMFAADSTPYSGARDYYYDPATGDITTSDITTYNGMLDFIQLPNGEYFGWNNGGLFTTQTLFSGITETSDVTVTVYPNPATNYITVEGAHEGTTITVTNNLGQVVLSTTTTQTKTVIDIQDLSPGLYFVNRKKLVVQ